MISSAIHDEPIPSARTYWWEVGYVEFERVGMNLIERGKETVITDGTSFDHLVRDYTETAVPGREVEAGRYFLIKGVFGK